MKYLESLGNQSSRKVSVSVFLQQLYITKHKRSLPVKMNIGLFHCLNSLQNWLITGRIEEIENLMLILFNN